MRLIVYSVIWTEVDDLLRDELDNIFPTEESAGRSALKIAKQSNIYQVEVYKDEVTEEYGRHPLRLVFREKHEERLGI